MVTITRRVYGTTEDGRTVLLYTPGTVISDDDARRAGILPGVAPALPQPHGLTILEPPADPQDAPPKVKALDRMTLAELRGICADESIDPGEANTRAEFIAEIEAARKAKENED